ncbi:MAG TPA: TonB-dependent receptor, partial [Gemmatimonadales bacterium]|nr:TonB-dependent receptor [Gemmatimonadales bacterium]
MFLRTVVLAILAAPSITAAQGVPADSSRPSQDTVARAPVKLHEITVTTTPARREEPASTVQVPAAELRQTPAINTYELLRQTAGLEVHDQGQGPGFAATASLRGFSSDHSTDLALWIDGVPVNEPVNAHSEGYNDWSLLFPAVIRDIDVYRGPSSALFGNFALAGTVNVRTLERYSGAAATLAGGAYGRAEGIGLAGLDRPGTRGVFALRGLREDGWRPQSGYQLGQAHGRIVRDLSPRTSLDAGVELYAAGWDSPGFLTADQFENREFDVVVDPTDGGFKRRAQERASLRVLSGSTVWRTTVYATQGRWQLFLNIPPEPGSGEGTGSQTEEEDRRYGFGLTSALTWPLSTGEITVGTEGRWDHSDYQNYLTVARVREAPQNLVEARQLSGALFAQSSIDLMPRVRINAGARLDAFDTRSTPDGAAPLSGRQSMLSPKLGALYQFRPELQVYANVSRGFRQTDGVVNEPSLPMITAWSYETGFKLGPSLTHVSLTLFRMDVSNEQTFDPISLATSNGGESRRQGVELGARA